MTEKTEPHDEPTQANRVFELIQGELPEPNDDGHVDDSQVIKGVCLWLASFGLLDGSPEEVLSRLERHAEK